MIRQPLTSRGVYDQDQQKRTLTNDNNCMDYCNNEVKTFYKTLANMLYYLFHALSETVAFELALTTVNRGSSKSGRQKMLTPPRHLILPWHFSGIRTALHSILYLLFEI
jgi:hypothetical protein